MITSRLLNEITERRAKIVLLDITGVPVVDTAVAHHLLQAARAVQLLGAELVLVGIRPEIAQTIVQLGVNLDDIITWADLQAGFAYALERQGLGTIRRG
jgi:rsbT co-antagonist protein RsbR